MRAVPALFQATPCVPGHLGIIAERHPGALLPSLTPILTVCQSSSPMLPIHLHAVPDVAGPKTNLFTQNDGVDFLITCSWSLLMQFEPPEVLV
jgi:hypothetical protein